MQEEQDKEVEELCSASYLWDVELSCQLALVPARLLQSFTSAQKPEEGSTAAASSNAWD